MSDSEATNYPEPEPCHQCGAFEGTATELANTASELTQLQAEYERVQQRLIELGDRPDAPPFTREELQLYHKRLIEAVGKRDDELWDRIFVEYLKDCLARERDDDPYLCIAAFVRGSTQAAFKMGVQIGERTEKQKRKKRSWKRS